MQYPPAGLHSRTEGPCAAGWKKPPLPDVLLMNASGKDDQVHQQLRELLPRLRRFARSLSGHPQDADDLVQTAVERALLRAGQWREELGGLDAWMFGIVRNAWKDELRARRRRFLVFAPAREGEQVGQFSMDGQLELMSVQAAMERLPEDQRVAVALVLVEGLSYREAAAVADVPIGTLTSRLARGREALQNMLGEPGQ
jgi:RNA polymerase sigma-70 factor, ECF subfamily